MPDRLTPLLEVDGLEVSFLVDADQRLGPQGAVLRAVDGVSFVLASGRTLGLIGESGCGKTMTALALLGLVPNPGRQRARRLVLHRAGTATDLCAIDPMGETMRRVRGGEIGMVFQDAAASLSPVLTIGAQLCETIRLHRLVGRNDAEQVACDLLGRVGLPDPARRLREYAHQLSGGMSQRVAIALALAGEPRILVADEPTTALDVLVQRQVLALIRDLQQSLGMAMLYITHDIGLVEDVCDDVAVMYLGRIVEQAPARVLLDRPLHPYTIGLLDSRVRLGESRPRLPTLPGAVSRPIDLPEECAFFDRCRDAQPHCRSAVPALVEVEPGHHVRCYLHSPKQDPGNM